MWARGVVAAALLWLLAPGGVALADTGALDPAFGTAGVASIAGVGNAQDRPIVLTDGRVLVLGIRGSDGRAVVTRLRTDGTPDPSFGSGGTAATGLTPNGGVTRFGLTPDGRVVVAAGVGGAKIGLERLTTTGAADWSKTVNLGGSFATPSAVVPISNTKTLVAASNDGGTGHANFTIARVDQTLGLDPQFGASLAGVARTNFNDPQAQIAEVAVLSNGAILAAGGTGDLNFASSGDTALARFTSAGVLDTSFGSGGKARFDFGGIDVAAGLAVAATGTATITGTTGTGTGYAARISSTGVLDTTFGTGGVVSSGLAPSGSGFAGTDVALDDAGRALVAGNALTGVTPATARWTVTRLKTDGSRDTGFGTDGRATVPVCDGPSTVAGLRGIAVPSGRLLASGACTADGHAAVARFYTQPALPGVTHLTVSPRSAAAGRERIRLSQLDPLTVLGSASALQSAPVRSSSLSDVPVRSSDIAGAPVRSSPVRSSVLVQMDPSPTLASVPVRSSGGWSALLAGTVYADTPLQSITLEQVFALNPLPDAIASLTLGDLDLSSLPVRSSPVRSSTLAAFLLSSAVLADLPAPSGGWCAFLSGMPLNCGNGASVSGSTLFGLEQGGDDLSGYYRSPLLLAAPTDISNTTLAAIRLSDIALDRTPLATVPSSEYAGATTVGDLVAKLPLPSLANISLGQLLAGIIPPQEVPYELAPLSTLLDAADLRATGLQTYTTTFDLDCGQSTGLRIAVTPPDGARMAAGSGRIAAGSDTPTVLPDPTRADGAYVFSGPVVEGVCGSRPPGTTASITLTMNAEPGPDLGPAKASVAVSTASTLTPQRDTTDVAIDDSNDPPADGSRMLGADAMVTGHIASAGDVDTYTFAAPPLGSRVTVTLSHLPADYDLVIRGASLGVASTPVRSSPVRSSPVRSSFIPDSSGEPTDQSIVAPDSLQDIPVRSSPVRSSSINRGTADEAASVVVRSEDAGNGFAIQVSGFNGASSAEPYVLRVKTTPGSSALPCYDRGSLQGGPAGSFPSLPLASSTQALFLVDRKRMSTEYGQSATDALLSKLATFAQRSDVQGAVIPVESDPTVDTNAAFAAWDADPCSSAKADAVVTQINKVVDHVRAGLPQLRSIVLVGGDDVLPQARVPDDTQLSNESEYADDAAFGGKDNAVSRALRDAYLLSDDPYGDFDPQTTQGGTLYAPDVALGRLLETPGRIAAQLDQFTTAGGVLDPRTASVAGYDFLSDGARQVATGLQGVVGAGNVASRIDDTWDATYAIQALGSAPLSSIDGHYNHFAGLPAAAFSGQGSPDLFTTGQVTPPAGALSFTMGCHAGLNLQDVLVASPGPTDQRHLRDWPQTFGDAQATYAGNTGFGYGDTDAVAYSERVMAGFAQQLGTKKVTAGQALMLAKQGYVADLGSITEPYVVKALAEATFYGLPMYRIGQTGQSGVPILPSDPPTGSSPLVASSFSVDPSFHDTTTDRGRYWTADGGAPLVIQRRPVQPQTALDVTASDGLPVHGVLVDALATNDVSGVDPVYARPTVDLSAHEPEQQGRVAIFPATLASVVRTAGADGLHDRAVLTAGQFRSNPDAHDGSGVQRLFTHIGGKVLRSASSDWTPPNVARVDAEIASALVSFRVEVDGTDAVGGVVLYRTDADSTWRSVNLAVTGAHTLGAGVPLPAGATTVTEWDAEVYDGAGNVGATTNKGRGYVGQAVAPPPAGSPVIVFNPGPPASGYYTAPPSVSIDPNAHAGATFQVAVDGGDYQPYGGPFTPTGLQDGPHRIDVRGSDGSTAAGAFILDTQGPTVTGAAARGQDHNGWYSKPVAVHFECADAASGVASCPGDATVSTEGRNQSVTGTATDRAGNSASGTVGGIDLDRTGPTLTVTSSGLLLLGAKVQGTAADTLSGVDRVSVTYTPTFGGTSITKDATLSCNAGRTACTWKADSPPTGAYQVVAHGTDIAGNDGASSQGLITVG